MADEYNHRVQVYQFSGGAPVYSATIGVTGESGADNTHLNGPTQVAFDSSGRLYILDEATTGYSGASSLAVGRARPSSARPASRVMT